MRCPNCQDILDRLPPALTARLLAALDLNILWNKPGRQATVHATITDQTLNALPAILDLDPGGPGCVRRRAGNQARAGDRKDDHRFTTCITVIELLT